MIHRPIIVCDLEATCWKDKPYHQEMEIIEIGAVRIADGVMLDEFHCMVQPVLHPKLSDFCQELTTIRQEEVDQGLLFPQAYMRFLEWMGAEPFLFASWGSFDLKQLKLDTVRHALPWDIRLDKHRNIKHLFAKYRQVKPCGLDRATQYLKIPFAGIHHRALDDSRNVARITLQMLTWLQANNHLAEENMA